MASNQFDVTLLGFQAADIRDINVGDVLVFRSGSIAHRPNLKLRHGRTCKVAGFSRNRAGQQQVAVQFLQDQRLGDDGQAKLTAPIPLAASNLVKDTPESRAAGKQAHALVEAIISQCAEQKRPWLADSKVTLVLGEAGMYDRLGEPKPAANDDLNDLPY